jgi:hypothetical protein
MWMRLAIKPIAMQLEKTIKYVSNAYAKKKRKRAASPDPEPERPLRLGACAARRLPLPPAAGGRCFFLYIYMLLYFFILGF